MTIQTPMVGEQWVQPPHRHKQHEISLISRGACSMFVNHTTVSLSTNTAFYMPPGVFHAFESESGMECVCIIVDCIDAALVEKIGGPCVKRFELAQLERDRFVEIAGRLKREATGRLPLSDIQITALVHELIVMLVRSEAHVATQKIGPDQAKTVEAALSWIHDNAHKDIGIDDLAKKVGWSESHLRKRFKQCVGLSPKRYLISYRVQRSKYLMLQTNQMLTEIAALSGFGSLQRFSEVFRAQCGVTPSQWRRQNACS